MQAPALSVPSSDAALTGNSGRSHPGDGVTFLASVGVRGFGTRRSAVPSGKPTALWFTFGSLRLHLSQNNTGIDNKRTRASLPEVTSLINTPAGRGQAR